MPSHNERTGLVCCRLSPSQYLTKYLQRHLGGGEENDIEAEERGASHGVDVAQSVGARYPSKGVGIACYGGEEVGGDDERFVFVELIYSGIVAGIGPNKEPIGVRNR